MSTRDVELRRLDERRKDSRLSYAEREEADQTLHRIDRQAHDSRMEELRSHLLRADESGDAESVHRIGREIEDHQRRNGL